MPGADMFVQGGINIESMHLICNDYKFVIIVWKK